jgi:hypothetical protein
MPYTQLSYLDLTATSSKKAKMTQNVGGFLPLSTPFGLFSQI